MNIDTYYVFVALCFCPRYDKLKPYGFAIHGCIDGFSRRIMWLEVNPSNNNPAAVAKYYVDCIGQNKGEI